VEGGFSYLMRTERLVSFQMSECVWANNINNKTQLLNYGAAFVKKQNPQADTSALEREIDQLVYKLYDLTSDEIDIIEGNINKEE
jgi:hypothetical protein